MGHAAALAFCVGHVAGCGVDRFRWRNGDRLENWVDRSFGIGIFSHYLGVYSRWAAMAFFVAGSTAIVAVDGAGGQAGRGLAGLVELCGRVEFTLLFMVRVAWFPRCSDLVVGTGELADFCSG